MTELFQLSNGPPSNDRGSFLVHRVNHNARVVERQNPVRLISMGEETTGEGLSGNQRDNRMPRHPGRGVGICRRSRRKKYSGSLFTAAVGLALHVHDRNDRTFFTASALSLSSAMAFGCEWPSA